MNIQRRNSSESLTFFQKGIRVVTALDETINWEDIVDFFGCLNMRYKKISNSLKKFQKIEAANSKPTMKLVSCCRALGNAAA